ncbi:MAG: hypothetical protein FJ038_04670 [Chloroflexi bacterium]|nr:hypothetical protein [Chloroflexota bacterium]
MESVDPGRPPARSDRFGLAIPILLAALGLAAAVIAWRGGVAANAADDATRAGLDAARQRAASVIVNEGLVARTIEAFLDYERSRQRADALAAAGLYEQALLERKVATSHWFLVDPDYLDTAGNLSPDRQRAALLADDASQADLGPALHFAVADAETARIRSLIVAGVILVFALPFLTLAEITAGRLRLFGVGSGILFFAGGLLLAGAAWA